MELAIYMQTQLNWQLDALLPDLLHSLHNQDLLHLLASLLDLLREADQGLSLIHRLPLELKDKNIATTLDFSTHKIVN